MLRRFFHFVCIFLFLTSLTACGGGGAGSSGGGSGGSNDSGSTDGGSGGDGSGGGGDGGGGDDGGGDPPFVSAFAVVEDTALLSDYQNIFVPEAGQMASEFSSEPRSPLAGIPGSTTATYDGYIAISIQNEYVQGSANPVGINLLSPVALLVDPQQSLITGSADAFLGRAQNEIGESVVMHYHGTVDVTTERVGQGSGDFTPIALGIAGDLSNVSPDLADGTPPPDGSAIISVQGTLTGGFYDYGDDVLRAYGSSRNSGSDAENSMTSTVEGMNVQSQSAVIIVERTP